MFEGSRGSIQMEISPLVDQIPRKQDTECGFWILKSHFLQRLASKKSFVLIFSMIAAAYSGSYTYTMGTLTTLEKRYKIPSKSSGMILVGHDISMMMSSVVITYFAAKGHRPRWIALGVLIQAIYCFLMVLPHFLYGPGEDALKLTKQFSGNLVLSSLSENKSITSDKDNGLCILNGTGTTCIEDPENVMPQVIFFIANFVSGLGGPMVISLGTTYMDDNIKKSKAPFYLSVKGFLRMLGPTLGYTLASTMLRWYIAPSLDPVIDESDPRWLGAWWIGWIIFGFYFIFASFLINLFPRTLPRAAKRKRKLIERIFCGKEDKSSLKINEKASLKDVKETFGRLVTNKVLIFNNLAGIFYVFGYLPFWTFQAKYIEIQYLLSSSTASLVTGTVSLVFSAIGILSSGLVISIYKPKARSLALWNIITSIISIFGVLSYALNGCELNDNRLVLQNSNINSCNFDCKCDYVKYSPICGVNNRTYISPCHAGCKDVQMLENGMKVYYGCSCINGIITERFQNKSSEDQNWDATPGVCPVNCMDKFYMFLIVLCFNKFLGGTEGTSNFLLGMRCIEERDKTISLAVSMTLASIFSLIPSPILFGAIIDSTCVLWGKTCSSQGNCWLYDAENLRYTMNITAAVFVSIGTCFDIGTWYFSKNIKIFDKDQEERNQQENAQSIELQ